MSFSRRGFFFFFIDRKITFRVFIYLLSLTTPEPRSLIKLYIYKKTNKTNNDTLLYHIPFFGVIIRVVCSNCRYIRTYVDEGIKKKIIIAFLLDANNKHGKGGKIIARALFSTPRYIITGSPLKYLIRLI